ncbi:metallophosphoesterase [Elusimicrobium minutum Pei191]|uniref:Metallophosphoesterase n=1 Tax=Elusimicrobium minutum (strain Pei191) TaxID=445932 RepID=B2KAY8_ELUMP|nr:metallophosphoesterase [Elusimicrobium minutum]ACC97684.1 metallophosphoesterase [Elusimicrobium minutum Pei191]
MTTPPKKDVFVLGDVHGHYDEFTIMLQAAELADSKLNWKGGNSIFVQMGDLIDRGPQSEKTDLLADKLQKQASEAGGEFVRLIGNHELEIIMGNFFISEMSKETAQKYQKKLIEGIYSGKYKAAYHQRGLLFTHAGACDKLLNILKMQLGSLTEAKVASLINNIFTNCVKHSFFKHPIFNISISRGGRDKYGGIFWEDLEDLYLSFPRSPVRQVVGHTMVDEVVVNPDKNIIATDIGLHRSIQYLKIHEKNIEVYTVS